MDRDEKKEFTRGRRQNRYVGSETMRVVLTEVETLARCRVCSDRDVGDGRREHTGWEGLPHLMSDCAEP